VATMFSYAVTAGAVAVSFGTLYEQPSQSTAIP